MANNRMFLKCKLCGERFMIGKYYPVSWAWPIDIDRYNEFLDKHDQHNAIEYQGDLGMEAEFYELEYENSANDQGVIQS